MTDGKIYMGETGELFKTFDVKDGCGIKDILPQYGVIPIIITARNSCILENRCKELEISELHQGVRNKLNKLKDVIDIFNKNESTEYTLSDCAYIGDDILDIQCMSYIKDAGGVVGCPADAVNQVKEIADFISKYDGGRGAVRQFIEWLVK